MARSAVGGHVEEVAGLSRIRRGDRNAAPARSRREARWARAQQYVHPPSARNTLTVLLVRVEAWHAVL